MRFIFCAIAVMVSIHAQAMSHGPSHQLCLMINDVKPKKRELLKNLVELHLLMVPEITVSDCDDKDVQYIFRQEISDISANEKEAKIVSALYAPDGRAIFGQIEFASRLSRKVMSQRARALAGLLIEGISRNVSVIDPFTIEPQTHETVRPEKSVEAPSVKESGRSDHRVELFVGMEQHGQEKKARAFGHGREQVKTRAYMIIGSRIGTSYFAPFVLDARVSGAATAYQLARPFRTRARLSLAMVDAAVSPGVSIYRAQSSSLVLGLDFAMRYFDSGLSAHTPVALSTFWQFKQGVFAEQKIFFSLINTSLIFYGAFYPLLQNLSLPSKTPFVNFSWATSFAGESTLYRSFGLKMSLQWSSDNFRNEDLPKSRLVSFLFLAYLGIVFSF